MKPVIETSGLTKRYRRVAALSDCTISVPEGRISALVGPNDDIIIPRDSKKTDWEVELALVIGKKARPASSGEYFHTFWKKRLVANISP